MSTQYVGTITERIRIPQDAHTFVGFHRWMESSQFPRTGRIDFLAGELDLDLAAEEPYTHNVVRLAIGAALAALVSPSEGGMVLLGQTRVVSTLADFSTEPDVVVVLGESLESGRVRLLPSRRNPAVSYGLEGADVIVEVVSDGSLEKDTQRLPGLYAKAGVPELWLVDARGPELDFQVHALREERYVPIQADAEGWVHSPRLGESVRLKRQRNQADHWSYTLESRDPEPALGTTPEIPQPRRDGSVKPRA